MFLYHNNLIGSEGTRTPSYHRKTTGLQRCQGIQGHIDHVGYLLIALLPLVSLVNIFPLIKISDLSIRSIDCLFLIVTIFFCLHVAIAMRLKRRVSVFLSLLLGFIVVKLLGFLICPDYAVNSPKYFRFIETMLWGGYALIFIRSKRQLDVVMNNVVAVGVGMSIVSIALYLVDPTLHRIAGYVSFAGPEGFEGQASFNEWGALYALVIGIILWRIYYRGLSFVTTSAFFVVAAGLMLVQSRSGFLAAICISFILFYTDIKSIFIGRFKKRLLVMFIFFLIVGIAGSNISINRFLESFDASSNAYQSMNRRIELLSIGTQVITKDIASFLLGYGSPSAVTFELDQALTTDNFFLDHALGEGVLGLLFILALVLMPIIGIFKTHCFFPERKMALIVIAVALVVSLTGNVLVDPTYGGITFLLLYGHYSIYG